MNLPAHSVVKIKEIPLWSIAVFVLGLVFSGGQLYAQQKDLVERVRQLDKAHEIEINEIRASIKKMERLEYEALAQIRVISNQIEEIKRSIDKLEQRTQARYGKD